MPSFSNHFDDWGPILEVEMCALGEKEKSRILKIAALVDTGCSGTCIDRRVIASLGLTRTGVKFVHTASTAGESIEEDYFLMTVAIMAPELFHKTDSLEVTVFDPGCGRHQALLGRDFLKDFLLQVDGRVKIFSLTKE